MIVFKKGSLEIVSHMEVARWVIERCPNEGIADLRELGAFQAYGIGLRGRPIAGVIFNWYRQMKHGNDMRVIIASDDPRWCLPGVLRELFKYPFEFAGCERLTAVIRDGNARSLKLCQGLGFKREGTLRRGYDGRTNAILLGMLKHECKWIRPGRPKLSDSVPKASTVRLGGRTNGHFVEAHR